jgi:hypothetical protein
MVVESPSKDRRLSIVFERWQCLFRFALSLTSLQELSKLELANDGHQQAFAHVLDLAYGRKGPLKWRIMAVCLVISCLCETLLSSLAFTLRVGGTSTSNHFIRRALASTRVRSRAYCVAPIPPYSPVWEAPKIISSSPAADVTTEGRPVIGRCPSIWTI